MKPWVDKSITVLMIVCLILVIGFCSYQNEQPKRTVIDGMDCIEVGSGNSHSIDCDWDSREEEDEKR